MNPFQSVELVSDVIFIKIRHTYNLQNQNLFVSKTHQNHTTSHVLVFTPACTRTQLGELRILGLGIPDFYIGQLLNKETVEPELARGCVVGFEEGHCFDNGKGPYRSSANEPAMGPRF